MCRAVLVTASGTAQHHCKLTGLCTCTPPLPPPGELLVVTISEAYMCITVLLPVRAQLTEPADSRCTPAAQMAGAATGWMHPYVLDPRSAAWSTHADQIGWLVSMPSTSLSAVAHAVCQGSGRRRVQSCTLGTCTATVQPQHSCTLATAPPTSWSTPGRCQT